MSSLIILIVVVWFIISFISGNMAKKDSTSRQAFPHPGGRKEKFPDNNKSWKESKKTGSAARPHPLKNTIPEEGTIADWARKAGFRGTKSSMAALEDRENDWLAREIRLEALTDNEFISEMKRLKVEHLRLHNRLNSGS